MTAAEMTAEITKLTFAEPDWCHALGNGVEIHVSVHARRGGGVDRWYSIYARRVGERGPIVKPDSLVHSKRHLIAYSAEAAGKKARALARQHGKAQ